MQMNSTWMRSYMRADRETNMTKFHWPLTKFMRIMNYLNIVLVLHNSLSILIVTFAIEHDTHCSGYGI